MVPAVNKAKRLSLVNHTTKAIYHHHQLHHHYHHHHHHHYQSIKKKLLKNYTITHLNQCKYKNGLYIYEF